MFNADVCPCRVADNPVREDVFDSTEIKLSFLGRMFGDIGDPHLVGLAGSSSEIMASPTMIVNMSKQVIMNRRAWTFPVRAAFLPIGRPQPVLGTQLPGGPVYGQMFLSRLCSCN